MTAGIYEISFSDGETYIGKSNNIERRWKEHITKFQKGTAAKAMQDAYNRSTSQEFNILFRCHEDHVDLMESIYIRQNWNNGILNTTQPTILSLEDENLLIETSSLLEHSTADHIRLILKQVRDIEAAERNLIQAVSKKEAACYRANKEVVDGLKRSIEEQNFNFDQLETAYDKLLNRDEFILELLQTISTKELRIKDYYSELEWSKVREGQLRKDIKTLKSRTLWERICNK